jgi:hypothetical protein
MQELHGTLLLLLLRLPLLLWVMLVEAWRQLVAAVVGSCTAEQVAAVVAVAVAGTGVLVVGNCTAEQVGAVVAVMVIVAGSFTAGRMEAPASRLDTEQGQSSLSQWGYEAVGRVAPAAACALPPHPTHHHQQQQQV